jgi:DNA replication protein DnaC
MQINANIENLCKELGLSTLQEQYYSISTTAASESWSFTQFLEEALRIEAEERLARSKSTLIKFASFPAIKTLEQFDYGFSIGVNRKQIEELSNLGFIKKHENIVLLGQPGVGKTHLAIALGYKAVLSRYKVKFTSIMELLTSANQAKRDKRYNQFLKSIQSPSVLIIDEIGYFNMSKEDANHFFQIISRRYESGSVILTSNLAFSQWVQIFGGDKVVTTAILDRIIHHSHIINIQGESYRLKEKKDSGILSSDAYKARVSKFKDAEENKTEVV